MLGIKYYLNGLFRITQLDFPAVNNGVIVLQWLYQAKYDKDVSFMKNL